MNSASGEDEYLALLTDLNNYEASDIAAPATLQIGPMAAYMIVTAFQLAWRHPGLHEGMAAFLEKTGRDMQQLFDEVPPIHKLIENGWDKAREMQLPPSHVEIVTARYRPQEPAAQSESESEDESCVEALRTGVGICLLILRNAPYEDAIALITDSECARHVCVHLAGLIRAMLLQMRRQADGISTVPLNMASPPGIQLTSPVAVVSALTSAASVIQHPELAGRLPDSSRFPTAAALGLVAVRLAAELIGDNDDSSEAVAGLLRSISAAGDTTAMARLVAQARK